MRAVGYVRVSTNKQENSADYQEKKIRAVAALREYDLVDIVVDIDKFSGNLNRPGAQKVIEMARNKEIDAVVITKLDRLSRSTRDTVELIELFGRKHVAFVSISEELNTETPIGRFVVRLIASIGELEREMIASRTRDGLANIRNQGFPAGEAPYGYTSQLRTAEEKASKIRKPLLVNEDEQKALVIIRSGMARGCGYKEIAGELNAAGHRTRTGGKWISQRVYGIWKNMEKARKMA